MPAPNETRTPGGIDVPGLNGPALNVPGRNEQPRTERAEQLKGLLTMAGGAVAGAIGSQARIEARAKAMADERKQEAYNLYRWVKERKEQEDNERQAAYRRQMAERLKSVERSQFQLLRDTRSTNAEWVMNEAVMRQSNAAFPEEQDAWNDFIIRHQQAARMDAEQEAAKASRVANAGLISDRRIAGKTAKNALDSLSNEVMLNAELRSQLIGDGKNIADRVGEYTLKAAMEAAPELFDLQKSDPFYLAKLEQQTILLDELEARANDQLVAPLTRQYVANTNKAMEEAGTNRIEIAAQAFAEGNLTASEYHDIVGDTMRTQFAHIDPKQLDSVREKLYRDQFNRLATLVDQPDPGKALAQMEALMSVADLNANERQIIREQIISDKFPKAIKEKLDLQIQQKMAEMSGITKIGLSTTVPRDPRTVQIEMVENGTYRDLAGQMLDDLGITGDPSTLTPLQANLLMTITSTVSDAEQKAMQAQGKAVTDVERATRFLSGAALTTEEANTQWQNGGLMRLFTGNLSPDDPIFQELATVYQGINHKDLPWDGQGPVPLSEDMLPIVQDAAMQEGRAWARNSLVTIPRSLANTIENMALYESPERAGVALSFWQGLGAEGQARVGPELSARAQMVLMEGNRLMNQDRLGRGLSLAEVANRIRTIDQNTAVAALRLAKDQAGLGSVTPDPRYKYDYSKALAGALGKDTLKDEYGADLDGFDIDVPGSGFGDALGGGANQGLAQVFGNRAALVPLYAQMAVVQMANPGVSLEEAATVVVARMREQGYKIVDGALGKQIVADRWGHYPNDTTPSTLLKQQLASPLTQGQANTFLKRLPNVGPQTLAMARDGVLPAEIIWSYLQERGSAGGEPVSIPPPSEWSFVPETNGPMFEGMMALEGGGVPMHLSIPGIGMTQMLVDTTGNPLLVVSSKRRIVTPMPVDKSKIPDYFLTPNARRRVPLKPDSAGVMSELLRTDVVAPRMGNKVL